MNSKQIRARLIELEPLVREYNQLQNKLKNQNEITTKQYAEDILKGCNHKSTNGLEGMVVLKSKRQADNLEKALSTYTRRLLVNLSWYGPGKYYINYNYEYSKGEIVVIGLNIIKQ